MLRSRVKKFLGQHFLHDPKIIQRIVGLIAPKPSDHLVEIGPGEGVLTARLLPLVQTIDAIEIDSEMLPKLISNCQNPKNLYVHICDVLQFDFSKLQPPLRLVGNLPYNISTPLLFKLIEFIDLIEDMCFMLQQEVAERIVACPGSKTYGRLSVMLQYYCKAELLLYVGSGAFTPAPKVSSAFIRLTPHKHHRLVAQDEKLLSEIARVAFSQRRKIIANGLEKYITASQLEEIGVSPKLRPEQLQVNEYVLVSNFLQKKN